MVSLTLSLSHSLSLFSHLLCVSLFLKLSRQLFFSLCLSFSVSPERFLRYFLLQFGERGKREAGEQAGKQRGSFICCLDEKGGSVDERGKIGEKKERGLSGEKGEEKKEQKEEEEEEKGEEENN